MICAIIVDNHALHARVSPVYLMHIYWHNVDTDLITIIDMFVYIIIIDISLSQIYSEFRHFDAKMLCLQD